MANEISEERAEEIRRQAHSDINWAEEQDYGPACTCGMKKNAGHANVLGVRTVRKCFLHDKERSAE